MLHQRLWSDNRELAEACLNEAFVQQLGHGTLAPEAFRCYVGQDAFFLRAFLGAYALGAAKCQTLDLAQAFHRLMGGVLEELQLHQSYAERLGIDLTTVTPLAATQAYVDFLGHCAWRGELDEIVAAMTPCMRLYAWLGQQLAPHDHDQHPYGDWIRTYASAEFEALAATLEQLLARTAIDRPLLAERYRYAMRCELAFFRAPLAAIAVAGDKPER